MRIVSWCYQFGRFGGAVTGLRGPFTPTSNSPLVAAGERNCTLLPEIGGLQGIGAKSLLDAPYLLDTPLQSRRQTLALIWLALEAAPPRGALESAHDL